MKIDGLNMWEALAGASQSLLSHRKSGYFLEPVDPVALGLEDYREVVCAKQMILVYGNMTCRQVKEPSDLGTVCSRVQRQGFATLQQVVLALFLHETSKVVSCIFLLLTPMNTAVGPRHRPYLGQCASVSPAHPLCCHILASAIFLLLHENQTF